MVLLPETDAAGAMKVTQSISNALTQLYIRHDVSPTAPCVTASIGGATCLRTTGHDLEELIKSADRALYKAKRAGRNRSWVEEVTAHKTLLLADTHPELIRHFSGYLQSHFNLLTAETHRECLDLALELHPDLILLGRDMADSTAGEELCGLISRLPKTSHSLLSLMSDHSTADIKDLGNRLNIRTFFDKSLSGPAFLNRIVKLLNNHH